MRSSLCAGGWEKGGRRVQETQYRWSPKVLGYAEQSAVYFDGSEGVTERILAEILMLWMTVLER